MPMTNKRWTRIVPVVFLMYTIGYMDRVNIGMAIPAMSKDLGFAATMAGVAAGIFFWGYLVFDVAGGNIALKFGAKRTILTALIVWGLFAILTGFAHSTGELLTSRFLMGLAEGPIWPSSSMLLAQWFPAKERGRAFGLWNLCIPVGAIAAAPLSGWLLAHWSWHVMFVVEGIPAWIWAVMWALLISERPSEARWLPEAEKRYLVTTLEAEQETMTQVPTQNWLDILKNPIVWLLLGSFSFIDMAGYGFSLWLPTALKIGSNLGIQAVGWLTALPWVMSAIGILLVTWSSDRRKERRFHTGVPMILTAIFLFWGVNVNGNVGLEITLFAIVGFFLYMYLPIMFTIPTEVLPQRTAIPAIALIGGVGNLFGGFVGPTLVGFLKSHTHSFIVPFTVLALFAVIAGVLVMVIRPKVTALDVPDRLIAKTGPQTSTTMDLEG
ncbi:MFS transporter [Alicyclobacillus tolerans]|uniref:MFS transporter n=1 Tax=Alicyclobacillus tolerans TaxID=90970 RepID=UPI001F3B2B4E|nr:MFS transporter [Alicyclobacillus tolerans]MCF8567843.1 MFS transporter [Alicyclobacillus tolerans]